MQKAREYTTLDFFFSLSLSLFFFSSLIFRSRNGYFEHTSYKNEGALQLHCKYFLLRFSILQELDFTFLSSLNV